MEIILDISEPKFNVNDIVRIHTDEGEHDIDVVINDYVFEGGWKITSQGIVTWLHQSNWNTEDSEESVAAAFYITTILKPEYLQGSWPVAITTLEKEGEYLESYTVG